MELLLLRYNNPPYKFNINDVESIIAEHNIIKINFKDNTTISGYIITNTNY